MANAVDQIFIDGNKMIDAPRLCGWIRHGQVAQNGTELNRQHAVRLWKTVRAADPELQKFGEEEDQNNVVPLTALKHIVMSKHLLANLTDEKLQAIQSQVGGDCGLVIATCFEQYTQAKALAITTHAEDGDVVQNFQNARALFGSVPKALGWIWTGPKSGRLVVSLPALLGANSEYFAVSDTNHPRYLDSVFGSADFERRWTLLCDAWEKNMPDGVPLPMLDRSGPTDFIGFMFFLKHAKGRAGDFAILDSTMIMGFVGLGDLRPVAALLKQAMNSNATAEERQSFGVPEDAGVGSLLSAVHALGERATETENRVTETESRMDHVVSIMSSASIMDQDRLLVSGYLSDKNYDFVRAQQIYNADRSTVLMTFGSLLMKKITATGLRNTVYEFQEEEEEADARRVRHWYSKSKHWQFFEESLAELDDALAPPRCSSTSSDVLMMMMSNVVVNANTFPSNRIWRDCCSEKFPHNDLLLYTFRDIGSDDVTRADTHAAKLEVALRRRDEGAYRVFRELYTVEMRKIEAGLVSSQEASQLTWGKLLDMTLEEYNSRRERKAAQAAAKAAAKAAKAAAKAASAKASTTARRRSRSPRS